MGQGERYFGEQKYLDYYDVEKIVKEAMDICLHICPKKCYQLTKEGRYIYKDYCLDIILTKMLGGGREMFMLAKAICQEKNPKEIVVGNEKKITCDLRDIVFHYARILYKLNWHHFMLNYSFLYPATTMKLTEFDRKLMKIYEDSIKGEHLKSLQSYLGLLEFNSHRCLDEEFTITSCDDIESLKIYLYCYVFRHVKKYGWVQEIAEKMAMYHIIKKCGFDSVSKMFKLEYWWLPQRLISELYFISDLTQGIEI